MSTLPLTYAPAQDALTRAPVRSTPVHVHTIQRACACGGSAGVSSKCASCESEEHLGKSLLQPKLQLNKPGDLYEQEADTIADNVVGLPEPVPKFNDDAWPAETLHRKVTPLIQREQIEDEESAAQGQSFGENIQRNVPAELADEDEMIQPRRTSESAMRDTGADFQAKLDVERSGGTQLDKRVRSDFESRLGVDLGHVRVHSGQRAAELARSIHAEAFTLGSHVYFGAGYYDPGSRRGRHLLAHELTHTIQQARGSVRYLSPGPRDISSAGENASTVRRTVVEDSFVPEQLPNGDLVHATILEELGAANPALFTEVKIPGATSMGLADSAGRADLYMDAEASGKTRKNPTTPAVIMLDGSPVYLESYADPRIKSASGSISRLLKGGKTFPHKTEGAPRGVKNDETGCDGNPDVKVCRLDKAPGRILLGDLKPPPSLKKAFEGTIQLEYYAQGISSTKDQLNTFIRENPGKADPPGTMWSPTTGKISSLTIPKDRKIKSTSAKKVPLRLYDNRKRDDAIPDFQGPLAIYKSKEEGIWTYEWIPEKIPAKLRSGAASPRVIKVLTRLNELVKKLKSPPATTAGGKKALTGAPPEPSPLQPRIQRKEAFNKDTWPGEFKAWQETEAKPLLGSAAIGPLGKVGVPTPESDEAKALRVIEGVKELKSRLPADAQPADFARLPVPPAKASGGIRRLQLWARWGPLLGRLRAVMGSVFVKVANLYDKAKERFERARGAFSAKEPSSGGSIGKAIISGAFRVATTFFRVLIERVTSELKRSLKQAAMVVVEDLVGEDRLKKIVEAKEDFESTVAGVEAKVDAEVEDVKAVLKPYEDIFEKLSNIRESISDIMRLVSAVRWGLRIVNCLTPPGLGCLKLLLQTVVEELAAKVISSCWFVLNFIKPLLTKFDIFTKLPGEISGFIIEQVKKIASYLPISKETLDKAFAPPAVRVGVTGADLECDEKTITPAQREMNKLLDKYGEAKIREIIKILEAAGLTKDREMTIADVRILAGLMEKIENGEVTKEDIEKAVENLKAGKDAGVPNIDDAIQQLSGLGGGGSGGGQGAGKGGGSGTGSGEGKSTVRRVSFDQAKAATASPGGTVKGTLYRALDTNPGHVKDQKVTITLGGFVNGRKVAEVYDVPATVEGFSDITKDGKPHRMVLYRIAVTVKFTHDVPSVANFVASPSKLIPGGAFPFAGDPAGAGATAEPKTVEPVP